MSKYVVEGWNKYDYPNHWSYEEEFETIDEAKEYIRCQKPHDGYRIILELYVDV